MQNIKVFCFATSGCDFCVLGLMSDSIYEYSLSCIRDFKMC